MATTKDSQRQERRQAIRLGGSSIYGEIYGIKRTKAKITKRQTLG